MPFPESPRVRYGKNPLVEVVCQLKFPTILRIDADPPVAFQEKVRHLFPEYRLTQPQLLAGVRLPRETMQMMFGGMGGGSHEFLAGDENSRVTLARDFVAFTTSNYSEWKDFSEMLAIPLAALAELYTPPYFSRVGLRYRDQIDRKRLGLEGVAWSDLLREEVAGELAHRDVAPDVVRIIREVGLKMPNECGNIRIVHGLEGDGPDPTYMIDADFFIERKVEHGETNDVLDVFNRTAGNLFRWCVKPRLHDAMEPRKP